MLINLSKLQDMHSILERIRLNIEKYNFEVYSTAEQKSMNSKQKPLNLTCTIGTSIFQRDKDYTLSKLVSDADKALYYGKEHGRNQVVID